MLIFGGVLFGADSYEILLFPHDARSLSLQNSVSAFDRPLLRNNPAALSMRSEGIVCSYLYLPANIHSGEIQRIRRPGTGISASKISILNYGTIIDSKTADKTYAFDVLLEMGYKKELKNITSLGVSGGLMFSSIAGFHSQLLFSNWGVRSRFMKKRLGIGFSLENIGFLLKSYTDVKESIPSLFRTAIYYKPLHIPLIISGDIIKKMDDDTYYFTSGLEFMPQNRLTIRLGNCSNRSGYITDDFSSDLVAGFSGGAGFRFTNITLDVGFMNFGPAGFIVGFSLLQKAD